LNGLKKHVDKIAANSENGHTLANYSDKERALIEQAQEGLPKNKWQRFLELESKQIQETIIKTEMEELLQLSDMLEVKDTERMEAIIKLADMWSISLEEVKAKLNIRTPQLYAR